MSGIRPLLAMVVLLAGCTADTVDTPRSTIAPTSTVAPPTTSAVSPGDSVTTTVDPSPAKGTAEVSFNLIAELGPVTDAFVDPSGTRLLVVEQNGRILDVSGTESSVVVDLGDRTAANGERGLLGATFTSDGRWLVVNYTSTLSKEEGDTIVAAYVVGPNGVIDIANEMRLLTIEQPYANHNGGDLIALADTTLLISTGDGGSGGDPERVAHRLDNLLGKILRLSVPDENTVPLDNPWTGENDARAEIWSSGLRNPWRIDVDPITGDLWVADVGQNRFEEISVASAVGSAVGGSGVDFGWSSAEGAEAFNDDVTHDPRTQLIDPIHVYEHGRDSCSISGGMIYRGTAIPALWGWYLFADFCSGELQALSPESAEVISLGRVEQPTGVVRGLGGEPVVVSATGQVVSVGPP